MPSAMSPIDHTALPDLYGKHCILRPLLVEHVTPHYVAWLNDPEVSRYLESRFVIQTLESVRDFVGSQRERGSSLFYGIWALNETHIGNIKLGPIDHNHLTSDLGFLIGDRDFWGKGIASEAITLIVKLGFDMGLQKITAGSYENNLGSAKALKNAGFTKEGFRANQVICGDRRFGIDLFGIVCS
jgi:[ribosomal protein S5]-alanine N-acetyltransferase